MKNTEKLNKRDRLINTLIVIIVIGGVLAVRYLPPAIAYWRSSEVYKRYSRVEGVRATYIKDFPLNDTLTVAVTLLEATDSAGWSYLLNAFNEPEEVRDVVEESTVKNKVWIRLAPKGHPEEKVSNDGQGENKEGKKWSYDALLKSYDMRTICVFDMKSMEQYMALFEYGVDIMLDKGEINYN